MAVAHLEAVDLGQVQRGNCVRHALDVVVQGQLAAGTRRRSSSQRAASAASTVTRARGAVAAAAYKACPDRQNPCVQVKGAGSMSMNCLFSSILASGGLLHQA